MKSILVLFILAVALGLTGCGVRDEVASIADPAAAQSLEKAKADAEFQKSEATAWKATDAKHQQQLADKNKSVAELQAALTNEQRERADNAARMAQTKQDLSVAIIARDRLYAALVAAGAVLIAVIAYALSDYLTEFQVLLRPIAYAGGGVAIAAWIFREVRPYAGPIEGVLLLCLAVFAVYELDIHTPLGKWLGWLLSKVETIPAVKKVATKVEADLTAIKATVERVV